MTLRLAFFLTFLLFAAPVLAQETVRYRDQASGVRELSVLEMLRDSKTGFDPALPYKIAAVDLNRDGIDEWILFQKTSPSCEADADCAYYIAGLSEGKPLLLGNIRANRIELQADRLYGINKIFVYRNKLDDYDFNIWAWDPASYAFKSLM